MAGVRGVRSPCRARRCSRLVDVHRRCRHARPGEQSQQSHGTHTVITTPSTAINDAGMFVQVQACVDALNEFVQGNMSGQNTHSLMDKKLVEVAQRLIMKERDPSALTSAAQ
eukprot:1454874-Prymnesium_polylepis.2